MHFLVCGCALAWLHELRLDLCAARRKFVEHREIEVTVHGECESTGDRCGGHREKVRRRVALMRECASLLGTEAVLLVNNRVREMLEFDRLLDERMRTDEIAISPPATHLRSCARDMSVARPRATFDGNFLQPEPVMSAIEIGRSLKYSINELYNIF